MNKERLVIWIKTLAVFGIGLALFFLWEQVFDSSFKHCNINSTVNCNAVINGEVSKTLGIP